jgi:low affinity Fe/Cu permease
MNYALVMNRTPAAETREVGDRRSIFDRFVETVYRRASQAPFFFLCAIVVFGWLISVPLWTDLKAWQAALHTVASIFTLLLVVLLENAGRRAEEAAQEKLDVIAQGLAALMESGARDDPVLRTASRELHEAIGLEQRH